MQKKLIVAAVAAVLAAPALVLADTANVTIYGLLNMNYESARNDKGTAVNHQRLSTNASRLGFKGKEDLSNGLKAFYQMEAQVDATGAGAAGLFNGIRNTAVGLEGSFGTAFMGNWDTPFKVTHNKDELFDNTTIFSATDIIGRESISGASFVTRQSSVVQYWSPVFNGFQAKLAYKPGLDATGVDKEVRSLSATYENDLFYAAYGYESKKGNKATLPTQSAANLTDSANRLVGAYKFKNGQVGLTYERLAVATTTTSTTTVSRNAWELSGKYTVGNNNFGAFYTRAGDLSGMVDSGAKQYSVRYGYHLSKHTELYGAYTRLDNDAAGKYDFSAGTKVTSTAGSGLTGFGIGMIHTL